MSHPSLMVACPSCGARPGRSCGLLMILEPHKARVEAYQAWKERLKCVKSVQRPPQHLLLPTHGGTGCGCESNRSAQHSSAFHDDRSGSQLWLTWVRAVD